MNQPLLFPDEKMIIAVVFAVRVGLAVYDCVTIQTNPELSKAVQHLEHAFLMCKEQIQKGKKVLMESRGEGQKKE